MMPDDGTPLIFNRVTGDVSRGDRAAVLTRTETRVLLCLAQKAPNIAMRETIYAAVWSSHTQMKIIDVIMCQIRRKFRDAGLVVPIATAFGKGYQLLCPVTIVPVPNGAIALSDRAAELLRRLLRECAARPSMALLSEYVRQAVFPDGR